MGAWEKVAAAVFVVALSAAFLFWTQIIQWLGGGDAWMAAVGIGFAVWCFAWVRTHNMPRAMPSGKAARAGLLVVAVVAGVLAAAFPMAKLMASRHEVRSASGELYVIDRLTGGVQHCERDACSNLPRGSAPPAPNTADLFDGLPDAK